MKPRNAFRQFEAAAGDFLFRMPCNAFAKMGRSGYEARAPRHTGPRSVLRSLSLDARRRL
jgi:hypothetical protein